MDGAEGTPMYLRDVETRRVVGANEAALALFGCSPTELHVVDPDEVAAVDRTDPSWYVGGRAELVIARGVRAPAPLLERLRQALERPPTPGETVALLFVDLEGAADAGSAAALDEVVLARLRWLGRRDDLTARTGAGSFVVLRERVRGEIEAAGLAAAIVDDLSRPALAGHQALPAVTVTLALAGDPGLTAAELDADPAAALAAARHAARTRHAALTSAAVRRARHRAQLTDALRRALANEEFVLHYQPIIDLRDGATVEVEALVRWAVPGDGLLGPDRFIPLAEETGLIVELGDWVLRAACRFAADRPGLAVAVNISARQVRDDLVARVLAALDEAGLAPQRLRLELTETAILEDPQTAVDVLGSLTALGVQLSHDDFGTGYASLLYLRRLPFDRLKIDRSFIRSIPDTPADRELVAAVLGVARAVGVRATAEGVETEDQARVLIDLGCEEAQGYFFGRPMPADAFDAWSAATGTERLRV